MKPFDDLKLAYQYLTTQFNGYSTMQWLETKLKNLVTPDVEGVALNSIADYNILHDGQGNIVIRISKLDESVEIGDGLLIKNDNGVPKLSTDGGETWIEFATQDALDAMPNWDQDDDGVVDEAETAHSLKIGSESINAGRFLQKAAFEPDGVAANAENLDDGTNSATAQEVRQHLDNVAIHVGGYLSVSNYVRNQFLQISDLATARHHFLDGWADSFISQDSLDPVSQNYLVATGLIKNYGSTLLWDSGAGEVFDVSTWGSVHDRCLLPAVSGGGNLAVLFAQGVNTAEAWIGHAVGSTYVFDGDQVRLTVDGGNTTIATPSAAKWSDPFPLSFVAGQKLLIATNISVNLAIKYASGQGIMKWIFNNLSVGANDPGIGASNTSPDYLSSISKINVVCNGLLSLQFLPYTMASAPIGGRCLVHLNPLETITPGTDITICQAADNASPIWEEFTTIETQELSDGSVLLDMEANFIGVGTTPTLKIETPTGKELEILAVEHVFTL